MSLAREIHLQEHTTEPDKCRLPDRPGRCIRYALRNWYRRDVGYREADGVMERKVRVAGSRAKRYKQTDLHK